MVASPLSAGAFTELQQLDTCTVSNAIERLNGRLRNEGSVAGSAVHCVFPQFHAMLGYAVTGRIRSTSPPVAGRGYHENMNWWRYLVSIPAPGIIVLQDMDKDEWPGALVGEIHALIGPCARLRRVRHERLGTRSARHRSDGLSAIRGGPGGIA